MKRRVGAANVRGSRRKSTLGTVPASGVFRPGLLALLAVGIGLSVAKPMLLGETLEPPYEVSEGAFLPPVMTHAQARRVSLVGAVAALEEGAAIFLDVRSEDEYLEAHVPGALSMPVDEIPARLHELDPAQRILTYCT